MGKWRIVTCVVMVEHVHIDVEAEDLKTACLMAREEEGEVRERQNEHHGVRVVSVTEEA